MNEAKQIKVAEITLAIPYDLGQPHPSEWDWDCVFDPPTTAGPRLVSSRQPKYDPDYREETCQCGEWPVSEYGPVCPSCPRSAVVIWDWREQPPWEEVNAALRLGLVYLTEVEDTGCDSYALVCSREAMSPAEAQRAWVETMEEGS